MSSNACPKLIFFTWCFCARQDELMLFPCLLRRVVLTGFLVARQYSQNPIFFLFCCHFSWSEQTRISSVCGTGNAKDFVREKEDCGTCLASEHGKTCVVFQIFVLQQKYPWKGSYADTSNIWIRLLDSFISYNLLSFPINFNLLSLPINFKRFKDQLDMDVRFDRNLDL